ncbi:MAG: alpha/beta fold hydrolase, partial [Flavobacteriales bacterium]
MAQELKEAGEFKYIDVGEGPPLLFLHGLFGALSNFEETIAHFSPNYRVIMPILPLYSLPMLNTNVKALASFLNRFVKKLDLKDINLLGNSLGGHVALVYSSKHPEMVRTLILTGSSGLYENAFGGGFPRREDKEFIRQKVAVTFYNPKFATEALVDECYVTVNDRAKLIRILSLAKSA